MRLLIRRPNVCLLPRPVRHERGEGWGEGKSFGISCIRELNVLIGSSSPQPLRRACREPSPPSIPQEERGKNQSCAPEEISHASRLRHAERGILLMECLVYMSLFFFITGLAISFFLACWTNVKELRFNAEDIAVALRTGERWRNDVRAATGALHVEDLPNQQILHIPQTSGDVQYCVFVGSIWRRTGGDAPWTLLLGGIRSSHMRPEPRGHVTAWRWELELATRRKSPSLHPALTFQAVSAGVSK